jgi:hypothetical protein
MFKVSASKNYSRKIEQQERNEREISSILHRFLIYIVTLCTFVLQTYEPSLNTETI